jgi:hypothetical protein
MPEIEIEVMSATKAAVLLESYGHLPFHASMRLAESKLVEVMGQELFHVARSPRGNVRLAYAGGGLWVKVVSVLPLPPCSLTPNDGAGTEDFAPNH